MTKIALPIAELKPALTGFGKIIGKRPTLPVLNHLKIERTKDGWIALTGTDLDHYVTCRLEQPSEGEPLSLLVPYDELLKITKNCQKTDTLLIRSGESASELSVIVEYAIGNQLAEAKVESLPVEEFPPIPRIKGEPMPVNDALRLSVHQALECASVDETRLILNGAFIDVSDVKCPHVVGTDGRHLFTSNSFTLPLKEGLIIPDHKFLGWKEFNADGEWQLKVNVREKKDEAPPFQISSRRWRFISRQIDGIFPFWRQVVPDASSYNTKLELDPATLDQIIQTVERMPCHDELNQTIIVEWSGKKLSLIGKPPNSEKWTKVGVEDATGKGKDVTFSLNRHLLAKALSFGLTTVEIIDPLSPLRFSEGKRQMIVMPIRFEGSTVTASPAQEPSTSAPPQAEQPERSNMPRTNGTTTASNGNGEHEEKTSIQSAVDQIEIVKTSLRAARDGLNELLETLKQVQRDHKASNREVQSVRTTLEKLQSVKL